MSLLEEIRKISKEAARQLESVECCTDQDIRSLTQNDLQELLPGIENFRSRKKIYEIIHKKRPIQTVLNELKGFIPDNFLIDAFSSSGALHDYLQMLKALKSEVSHVQEFLDAHIDLLEKFSQREDVNPNKDQALVPSVHCAPASSSKASSTNHFEHDFNPQAQSLPFLPNDFQNNHKAQGMQLKPQVTVKYKVSVSGNTMGRHMDVLERVKTIGPDSLHLQEVKHVEYSQVTIVFCPIVSRVGTDIEAALQPIQGGEKVILVLMHHSRTACPGGGTAEIPHNVVLTVHVFFHETIPGLVACLQNTEAINLILNKLLMLSTRH